MASTTTRKYKVGSIHFINDTYGSVEILENNGKSATIKFLNTGNIRDVLKSNIPSGKCRDETLPNRNLADKTYPNTLMNSNGYGDFILLERQSKDCLVQFVDTGYTTKCLWENIKLGKIRDPYRKSCYGVAYTGEYKDSYYSKQAKQLWNNVIKRCYSDKDPNGYKHLGVTVDERWLCFANFLEDLPKLQNFELWLKGKDGVSKTYDLDKDHKVPGNKVYSREACMFICSTLNRQFKSFKT